MIRQKNGTREIELRKFTGYRRDWRRWLEAVSTVRGIKDGERRKI